MPRVSFSELPDSARVWVFASDRPLSHDESVRLLGDVDVFLDQWKAHGAPLRNARDFRDNQFLVIGVDPSVEQASGCSIDGLFRALQQLQKTIGAQLLGGGRVFYRDASGATQSVPRDEFATLTSAGKIGPKTPIFDTSLTELSAWKARFERPLSESWAAALAG